MTQACKNYRRFEIICGNRMALVVELNYIKKLFLDYTMIAHKVAPFSLQSISRLCLCQTFLQLNLKSIIESTHIKQHEESYTLSKIQNSSNWLSSKEGKKKKMILSSCGICNSTNNKKRKIHHYNTVGL